MVKGQFKTTSKSQFQDSLRPTQKFYSVKDIEIQNQKDIKSGKFKLNSGGADQLALQKALDASKSEFQKKKEESETEKKEFFKGKGISLNSGGSSSVYIQVDSPVELQIIKLSLKEVRLFNFINQKAI